LTIQPLNRSSYARNGAEIRAGWGFGGGGDLLCVLSLLFGIIHYGRHCEAVSGGEGSDAIVLLRWEQQRHLVRMQMGKNNKDNDKKRLGSKDLRGKRNVPQKN